MTKYRLLYITLILAAVGLSMGYQSSLTTVVLYTVLILPVLSLILLVISRFAIHIDTVPKHIVVHKEQSFTTSVLMKNRFFVPLAPIRISGIFQGGDSLPRAKQIVVSVSPLNKIEVTFNGSIRCRGEYVIGTQSVELVDLLKLFRLTIRFKPSLEVIVIPRRLSPASNLQEDSSSESVRVSPSFYENDTFSSVRKYREGDNLRHVHWKLSAKQDELVVRQMEQNISSGALIFFDLNGYGSSELEDAAATDVILETALALVLKTISEGNTAFVIFNDPETQRPECIEISSGEEYEMLYGMCAVIPYIKNGPPFVDTLRCFDELLSTTASVYAVTARISDDITAQVTQLGIVINKAVSLMAADNAENRRKAALLDMNYSVRACLLDEKNLLASINEALE